MRRVPAAVLIGSMLGLAASTSMAIGFGRVSNATVLGHSLEFSAAVHMEADEWLGVECVSAEVTAGDSKLAPATVRVRLDPPSGGTSTVRVSTTVRIDEPVVTVKLLLGCPVRLSREFVAFVDPPLVGLPQTAVAEAATPTPAAPPATSTDAASTSQSSTGVTAPERAASPPAPAQRVAKRVLPRRVKRPTIIASTPPRSNTVNAAAAPPSDSAKASVVARAPAAASGPRLMLDPAQALLKPTAPAASVAGSTLPSAVATAAPAGDASDAEQRAKERERVAGLENRVERMLKESQAQQQTMAALQARLRETEGGRSNAVLYGLMALVALLLLVIAAMLWRQSRFKGQSTWWSSGPMDLDRGPTASELERDPTADRTSTPTRGVPQPVVVEVPSPPPMPAKPAPVIAEQRAPEPPSTFPGLPRRDLTVEELIDLEQQADFFIVLGQEEAAIDLLMGHVRSSGGASPMPYLKLLDIYRRRSDREAYARIRERFNRRFNAYAPEYESDPRDGRTLERYAPVMARLQAVWPTPNKAMDLLQSLLFRRDSSDGTFDLPAYGELLFLYAHARDLAEHETYMDGVDLLLPLPKADEEAMTRTIKLAPAPPAAQPDKPYPIIEPTATVDLELDLRDPDTGVKV